MKMEAWRLCAVHDNSFLVFICSNENSQVIRKKAYFKKNRTWPLIATLQLKLPHHKKMLIEDFLQIATFLASAKFPGKPSNITL